MHQQRDPALVTAFEQALYEVELSSGNITFRVAAVPRGDLRPLHGRSVTVVTAYNPGQDRPSEVENQRANGRLLLEIATRGWEHYPALGYSRDRSHVEPSRAVLDLSEAEACALGQRYRQAAVFYWDGAAARLIWCA